jgi:hypothetical protein
MRPSGQRHDRIDTVSHLDRTGACDPRRRKTQGGYLMAALAAAVAVMVIFSMLAFQAWVDVLRRDNELEMIFRAKDLVRAIQRYRRDHAGVAPLKLEDLMEPGPRGQYYLRQMWKDPLVTDGKWGLLYIGPGGQIIDPNNMQPESGLDGGLGGSGLGDRPSIFDRDDEDDTDGNLRGRGTISSRRSGQFDQQGQQGQQQQFKTISPDDSSADPNGGGKQISGLPIAGVRSLCEEKPFRVYNGLTEYREWLFTYLDLEQAALPSRGRQPGSPGMQQPGGNRMGRPGQRGPGANRLGPGRGPDRGPRRDNR